MTDPASNVSRLGKYELLAEIARGGMGIVYLANAGGVGGFNKLVVVKELKPELANEESFREMFLDEARLTARLNHRNIVQTNEVGMAEGRYFIAMDYLEGRALNRVTKSFEKTRPLHLHTQLRVLAETLAGLHYAHELADFDGSSLGIVHRDVCPQNVFITFDGQVKIVDFGVAKARNRLQETQAGTLKGRVAYMSPEHLGGTARGAGIDRRADVFAVGAMLWEMLAGQRFWGQAAELEILRALVERKIPTLPETVSVAPELREMVAKATAADPEKRFATAHEFRQQIEQYLLRNPETETLTDLGQRMMTAYADEREKLRKVIEGHVAKSGQSATELPKLDFKGIGGGPTSDGSISSVSSLPGGAPSAGASGPHSVSQVSAVSSASASGVTPSIGTSMATEVPSSVIARPPSKAPWVVGALGVVVAVGAVAFAMSSREPPVAKPAATQTTAPIPSDIPQSDLWETKYNHVDSIDLTIVVAPPSALIFLDGAQLPSNPYAAKYKKGGRHKITATAPGYAAKSQDMDFESNVQVTMSLDKSFAATAGSSGAVGTGNGQASSGSKDAAAAATATTASPGITKPTTTGDINPQGGTAPVHKIDPNNPYGN